jgi:threonine synthase
MQPTTSRPQSAPATGSRSDVAYQQCINPKCGSTYDVSQVLTGCPACGSLLDVRYDWDRLPIPSRLNDLQRYWAERHTPLRFSGVWRFHELLPFAPADQVVTVGEGQTLLQTADPVAAYVDIKPGRLHLQYEGMNPSGSLQRQRHVRGLYPRPDGRTPSGPPAPARATPARRWRCTAAVTRLMRGR